MELPLKTNCDTIRTWALIAQGDRKKEIVFHCREGVYGVEINYCPICGRSLTVNPEFTREWRY